VLALPAIVAETDLIAVVPAEFAERRRPYVPDTSPAPTPCESAISALWSSGMPDPSATSVLSGCAHCFARRSVARATMTRPARGRPPTVKANSYGVLREITPRLWNYQPTELCRSMAQPNSGERA